MSESMENISPTSLRIGGSIAPMSKYAGQKSCVDHSRSIIFAKEDK